MARMESLVKHDATVNKVYVARLMISEQSVTRGSTQTGVGPGRQDNEPHFQARLKQHGQHIPYPSAPAIVEPGYSRRDGETKGGKLEMDDYQRPRPLGAISKRPTYKGNDDKYIVESEALCDLLPCVETDRQD